MYRSLSVLSGVGLLFMVISGPVGAQEASVRPGINDPFQDPDVPGFVDVFEVEKREIFSHRASIAKACRIEPGTTLADIGAGTGIFTRLLSDQTGPKGTVIAIDIAQKFLDHIEQTCRESKRTNVITRLGQSDSIELPPDSIDVAFVCDTYHHFEFPRKTLASIHRALKEKGRLIVVELHRIEGKSSDWALKHLRAGKEVFLREINEGGFQLVREESELLEENYFLEFVKE